MDRAAWAADTIIADWENNGPTGMGGAGTDFDPAPVDSTASCTGCWFKDTATAGITFSQSTFGATHGTKSFQLSIVGHGTGGGDGLQDTHFDRPAQVIFSVSQNDPRALAIRDAVNSGNQGLYTIQFDVTYNIPALRALDWLGPPVDFPAKPTQFIGLGIFATASDGVFTEVALEQALPTLINPFDAQWNGITALTRHISLPLSQFGWAANPATPETTFTIGFSSNGNWGTNPASTNTEAASYYIDDMELKQFNPVAPIDYNHNGVADVGDWTLFMGQFLKSNPAAPPLNPAIFYDLVGGFGAVGTNGKVDFADLQEFQRLYHLANPGAGALGAGDAPEPGSVTLALLGLLCLIGRRIRGPLPSAGESPA
jgi:hypothetical protein